MKNHLISVLLPLLLVLVQGCMADLRPSLIEKEGIVSTNEEKGKMILLKAWKKQGLENLSLHETYLVRGQDVWKGMMGKLGKPWPDAAIDLQLKYAVGTFDSQVIFQSGKRQDVKAGLQSWRYYEQVPGSELTFVDYDERIAFGLSAYQYFFELLDRLRKAPIISYAGEKMFKGRLYDQVFVSWDMPEPHQQHDQYVLWINRESGMLDYALYTLRENYLKMPGSKAFYGSIQFKDWRPVDGILIPHTQLVYLNSPKEKEKKHLHQLRVEEFAFDTFSLEELYPNPEIDRIGDDKVAAH
ncbi:MAG: hypothetical protein KDD15_11590 [Lewinella sp.]|nr:hypothetical protein [Lewinella sp.]